MTCFELKTFVSGLKSLCAVLHLTQRVFFGLIFSPHYAHMCIILIKKNLSTMRLLCPLF